MSLLDRIASDFRHRVPAMLLVAAACTGGLLSLLSATWFRADLGGREVAIGFMRVSDEPGMSVHANPFIMIAVVLASIYFFARLFGLFLLLFFNGPTTGKVAWLTPMGACIQGLAVLMVAAIGVALVPELEVDHVLVQAPLERSYGGALLVVSLLLAQVAIHLIARDPSLSATQTWKSKT